MASWNQLLDEFGQQQGASEDETKQKQLDWLKTNLATSLSEVRQLRGNRNVLLYGSAFLQKPDVPGYNIAITSEDLNGLMAVIHGMDWNKGLAIILHTPGGQTNATETVVSYLRSKFSDVEVIVPAFAMSAGTMIGLSADRIVMGRQSQLGPIDPQLPLPNGLQISARAVVEQFDRAKADVLGNQLAAHVWAPVLQSMGPSLLQEAQNALDYSENMVARWLAKGMFKEKKHPDKHGAKVAKHFNDASTHKSHGRRIDRDEARLQGVVVEHLEDSQDLQEAVLSTYHLMTLVFAMTPTVKVLWSDAGSVWAKSWTGTAQL
ncbi:S49 family peptidase [Mycolicibacterium porcinum]|uniref:SDH family Clp fold serine proteinase n=1 Tax=Mycolicibacterium porcinum TaxID=39693 RepID=UPI0031F77845